MEISKSVVLLAYEHQSDQKKMLRMTHERTVKQESKIANCDWVDHQACSLLQYIYVIANLFIMRNYFNELR